jgi:hypothetical protein
MKKQYAHIIYLEEHDLPDDFFTWSAENQLNHLKQWDTGDYYNYTDKLPTSHYIDKFTSGNYIMAISSAFGHASLTIQTKGN